MRRTPLTKKPTSVRGTDHPIPCVRCDPLHGLICDQHPALGLPNVCARGKTRVQQDVAVVVRHGPVQELVARIRDWRPVPRRFSLCVPVGRGPLCAVAHGVFVRARAPSCVCLSG